MIPQLPRLADYSISPRHGFLPGDVPLERLPGTYYAAWERIVANLQALIISGRLRGIVDRLPLLSTDFLATEAEWQRAYTVLAFISHAYVWGGNTPSDRVPPSISIPFLVACRYLDLPPVATYASVVLWNWKPLFADEPIDNLENLATVNTFTGSLDESWFYLISAAIEARGGPIIPMMLDAIAAVRHNDSRVVTECLRTFAERLDELGAILQRMYEYCDPHVFYHRIRPFLAGSKNMGEAGLPNGVMFDTGSGSDDYVQYSGGSNAQSSLIQFFDLVLGVEHRPTGERAPDQSSTSASDSEAKSMRSVSTHNFITDMRTYMPGSHRRFLEHVASVANIRDYVDANRSNRALCTAFDACLAMLRAFRDKHIQMVSRYIIVKSRESRSESRSISPRKVVPLNLAASSFTPSGLLNKKKLRGTGGTALIPFLKQARDETGEPAIDAWARRLLNNGPAEVASEEYSATYFNNGKASGGASLTKMGEHASGEVEIVGLAGTWSVDDSEGGICHW